jgi:hypothetical protein
MQYLFVSHFRRNNIFYSRVHDSVLDFLHWLHCIKMQSNSWVCIQLIRITCLLKVLLYIEYHLTTPCVWSRVPSYDIRCLI